MVWGLIAGLALLWPDRVRGPFDGVPLDGTLEAILIGVVFPALCCWYSGFLITRVARTCSVALLAWRICASVFLVQSGWCVQFQPARPFAKDAKGAPHAWDLRADWHAASPTCSAIMTRSYDELRDFPASFFNLPPDNDSWPAPQDRPPGATTAMRVRGYLEAHAPGVLQIDTGPDVQATVALDGESLRGPVAVAAGVHAVNIDATLTGDRWRLVPTWNGGDFWASVETTVRRPPPSDRHLRRWLAWIPVFLVSVLLIAWTGSAIALVGDAGVLAWTTIASAAIGGLVATDHVELARWSIAALAGAALVPVPQRLRGLSGACMMIGVPWLTFVVMCSAPAIGRWVLYDVGSDFWTFQRSA